MVYDSSGTSYYNGIFRYPLVNKHSYWECWFSLWIYPWIAWWFSIVFCTFTRGYPHDLGHHHGVSGMCSTSKRPTFPSPRSWRIAPWSPGAIIARGATAEGFKTSPSERRFLGPGEGLRDGDGRLNGDEGPGGTMELMWIFGGFCMKKNMGFRWFHDEKSWEDWWFKQQKVKDFTNLECDQRWSFHPSYNIFVDKASLLQNHKNTLAIEHG